MKTKDLIEAVRKVDAKAARYIESNAPELNSYFADNNDTLCSIFSWRQTPQGHDYWKDIDNRLNV